MNPLALKDAFVDHQLYYLDFPILWG
jgi:hypothetical protein